MNAIFMNDYSNGPMNGYPIGIQQLEINDDISFEKIHEMLGGENVYEIKVTINKIPYVAYCNSCPMNWPIVNLFPSGFYMDTNKSNTDDYHFTPTMYGSYIILGDTISEPVNAISLTDYDLKTILPKENTVPFKNIFTNDFYHIPFDICHSEEFNKVY